MDEVDGWLIGFGLIALSIAVVVLSFGVKSLQTDVELLRMTAAVPERHS